jgi:Ca2+-binding EF-hand superfamily protein
MTRLLAALVVFTFLADAAWAQGSGTRVPGKPGIGPDQAAAQQQQLQKMLDSNGDGRVDPAEMKAAQDKLTQAFNSGLVPPELKKRADRNGDGRLDPQEIAMLREMMSQSRPGAGPQFGAPGTQPVGVSPEMLKKFDKNGDGRLDELETRAAQEAMKPKSRSQQLKEKLDTNGDGKIDDAERAAAREAYKNRVQNKD